MARALALARRGAGRVSPNPMVGAVLVKAGRVVAEGWHERYGGAHAEVNAIERAGAAARGSVLYVNLEPCNDFGHVPPCTDAILDAGIARVVLGARDHHSKGRGGIARLRRGGLRVEVGVLRAECERLNERFFVYTREGRPHTTVKMAATLDGKAATASGQSKWITDVPARRRVHQMRGASDAVVVGIGTVLADNPELTVRLVPAHGRQPVPVVLDPRLRIPPSAKLLKTRTPRKMVVCSERAPATRRRALEKKGVRVLAVPAGGGRLDLAHAWRALGAEGITSVLVEGGPTLAWSVVGAALADRLCLFYAPMVLGCERALGVFAGGAAAARLSEAIALDDLSCEFVGRDLLVSGRPVKKKRRRRVRKKK